MGATRQVARSSLTQRLVKILEKVAACQQRHDAPIDFPDKSFLIALGHDRPGSFIIKELQGGIHISGGDALRGASILELDGAGDVVTVAAPGHGAEQFTSLATKRSR